MRCRIVAADLRRRTTTQISAPAFRGSNLLSGFLALLLLAAPLGALYAQDPHYLRAGRPDPNILASPPLPASPEQAADMAELVAVHSACTSNQMEAALSEKKFSLFTFRPALGDILQPGNLPKTEAFFERLLHDASMATDTAKDFWKR